MNPSFTYILVINREQPSQTLFLKAVAKHWAQQKSIRGLLLHEDNLRTDHIIQEGVPRAQASRLVARELNHRFVELLAEAGVVAVGFHLDQIARFNEDNVNLDLNRVSKVPPKTHLVVSKVVPPESGEVDLFGLAWDIAKQLHIPMIIQLEHVNMQGILVQSDPVQPSDYDKTSSSEAYHFVRWSIKEWEHAESLLDI